ncbi:Peptidyl-prolyl cis-trans isomerase CYP95 [Striga hermonthica]|uniref:Peptidyl-prolyl cis-trans isomerase CYP95 n=1 Tax=Striga hermonthica TaxID=68872 RepID=A0A9N7NW22_STRHE|nr:Peptidyl-prolyl cis-trans isomerase CYP95 [Striga hermonthica]
MVNGNSDSSVVVGHELVQVDQLGLSRDPVDDSTREIDWEGHEQALKPSSSPKSTHGSYSFEFFPRDVSVDGDPFERMIFELFTDVAPKTAENFRALCTGEYEESVYGEKFPAGLLSMAIADRDEKGSLFVVTFKADHRLDRKRVVFGKLVDGHEMLKKIEDAEDDKGKPAVTVKIVNSGALHDDKNRENNLKMGKSAAEQNNHSVKRKGKHKKSSKKKRKRRRYYTSESDSSSDTDIDSSDSDTDSESDASSLSDTSSSSDDRRKRRKRSKRDRHRRARKKDRRREKRRRRRHKKKRKSKRDNASDSESDNNSGSSSQDDVAVGASDVKHKRSDNQSPLVERENEKDNPKKGDGEDTPAREDGDTAKEKWAPSK